MKRTKVKPVAMLLSSHSPHMAAVLNHTRELQRIEDLVGKTLPATLREHCQVANYNNCVLIIHAESAVWATKLRFLAPVLTKKLKQSQLLSQLREILIKTRPKYPTKQRIPRRASISPQTAALLENFADDVTSPDLATALRKLAKRAEKP